MRAAPGIALVTVLLLLTMMFVTCSALQMSVLLDAAQARNELQQLQATSAADLAVNHALELLQAGVAAGDIAVASVTDLGDDIWLVSATATAGRASSAVQATVRLEAGQPPVVLHRR